MSEANVRALPYSAEAEKAVLGSIMIDTTSPNADRVFDMCQARHVQADWFFDSRHQVLYKAMQEVIRASRPLDYVTLTDHLRTTSRLETIGGAKYLQALYDQTPTAAHAEYYLNIVEEKRLRRQMINDATETIKQCYDENKYPNAKFILANAEKRCLATDFCDGFQPPLSDLLDKSKAKVMAIAESTERVLNGLPTGFRQLDETLQGLAKGAMIVIGARPSIGKTSLAMNIAENVATTGHHVLVFSLEMSSADLVDRMVSSGAGVNVGKLRTREIDDPTDRMDAAKRFCSRADKLKCLPLDFREVPNADIMSLMPIARRMKKSKGTDLIVIDYLQLCSCSSVARQNNRQVEVSEISRQIKNMARELQVPVIVLSQLSRESVKDGVKPELNHLRDSGAIEQDADVVMLLRRPCRDKTDTAAEQADSTLAYVNVAKNRNGETGEVALNFEAEYTRFSNR